VHRYYDPTTGQFLTVDPLVDETGQAYGYVSDDPVSGSDPNGLSVTDPGFVAQVKRQEQLHPSMPSVNCGPNFDHTGLCQGHPQYDYANGPSIFTHLTLGYGDCFGLCFGVQFQDGSLSASWGGYGFLDKGPYVGWANEPPDCRQGDQLWFGGGAGFGASGSMGLNTRDLNRPIVPGDWEFDVGGYLGFGGGQMSTHTWKLFGS
jgi:hypothetical protein